MSQDILVDIGEEFVAKNDLDGISIDIGLYDDSVDALGDTDNLGSIGTEPTSSNYARQSTTVSVTDISGNWGFETDATVTFDFSDVQNGDTAEQDIDTGFYVVNFQSTEAGDSSPQDNLFGNFSLGQTYTTGDFDELDIEAGDAEFTID